VDELLHKGSFEVRASARGLKLTLKVEVTPDGGVSKQKLEEMKSALRELGLNDDVSMK
jgi:hypothetical protein